MALNESAGENCTADGAPADALSTPSLLMDSYELTMAYSLWRHGSAELPCVSELFFRHCPFGGQFAVCAGVQRVRYFLRQLRFTDVDVDVVRRSVLPKGADEGFLRWLSSVDASRLRINGAAEGSLVFAHEPLLVVHGPLALVLMVESALLNLMNYATLVTTNAARFRLLAGSKLKLVEFGLRRAQGGDGALSASVYSYIGGFDASSNVYAAQVYGVPVSGTHAHAFVQSFRDEDLMRLPRELVDSAGESRDFVGAVLRYRSRLGFQSTSTGELAAFVAFAQDFPRGFVALIDTYNTVHSGARNFVLVALALLDFGYAPVGVRIDSGDLLSSAREVRAVMMQAAHAVSQPRLPGASIMVSNDLTDEEVHAISSVPHEVDALGIGTNLVTCLRQPALGGVYKLVEVGHRPCMKISESKTTLPGAKSVYRLYGEDGKVTADYVCLEKEDGPQEGQPLTSWRNALDSESRWTVTPFRVRNVHVALWNSDEQAPERSVHDIREQVKREMAELPEEIRRFEDPQPMPVCVSAALRELALDVLEHSQNSSR